MAYAVQGLDNLNQSTTRISDILGEGFIPIKASAIDKSVTRGVMGVAVASFDNEEEGGATAADVADAGTGDGNGLSLLLMSLINLPLSTAHAGTSARRRAKSMVVTDLC